jgi:hypothetical protein
MPYPDDEPTINLLSGSPSLGYNTRAHDLDAQSALADQNAMGYLNQAMGSTKEMSATQGIAAALLGLIPTVGGYLIGKSVGGTNYSDVPYQMNLDKLAQTGAYSGGLQGAKQGIELLNSYTGGLEKDKEYENKILAEKSNIEQKRAQRLQTEADQMRQAGLKVDSQIAMMPLELQQYAEQQKIASSSQIGTHIAQRDYDLKNPVPSTARQTIYDIMTPEQKANYAAKQAGVNADGSPVKSAPSAPNLSPSMEKDLAEKGGLINMARDTASKVKGFKSWTELQAAGTAGGLDPNAAFAAIRDTVDYVARDRSGAAIPPAEYEKIQGFIAGDITMTPAQVANFLEQHAERTRRFGENVLKGALQLGSDPTNSTIFAPPTPTVDPKAAERERLDAQIAAIEAQLTGR